MKKIKQFLARIKDFFAKLFRRKKKETPEEVVRPPKF